MLNALWTVDISINTANYYKKERENETYSLSVVKTTLYMENLFMLHKILMLHRENAFSWNV